MVGQPVFKALVLVDYQRHCAITGSLLEPVLEAAHVRPVEGGGIHDVDNGLLVPCTASYDPSALSGHAPSMADGYLGVDGDFRLRVSPRLKPRPDLAYGHGVQGGLIEGRRTSRRQPGPTRIPPALLRPSWAGA